VAAYAEIRLLAEQQLKYPEAFATVVAQREGVIEEYVLKKGNERVCTNCEDYYVIKTPDTTGGWFEDQMRRNVFFLPCVCFLH